MSRVAEAMRRAAPATAFRDVPAETNAGPDGTGIDRFGAEPGPISEDNSARPAASIPQMPLPAPSGRAPRLPAARTRPLETSPAVRNRKLIVSAAMRPIQRVQYKRLAAALHDLQLQAGLKILMVSSAVPQEGKTLTIANLALTFSEAYQRRTLLIDADLRCPRLHDIFGTSKSPGLADVLGTAGSQMPLHQISQHLTILTAGHVATAPLAQLTSSRFREVISEAATHFDWVLLDSPPISLLPDAQHVASVSDGTLLVIAAGSTPYKEVQRAIASIGPERVVGTLLNYADKRLLIRKGDYGKYFEADLRE